jgi:hypothetical protein
LIHGFISPYLQKKKKKLAPEKKGLAPELSLILFTLALPLEGIQFELLTASLNKHT